MANTKERESNVSTEFMQTIKKYLDDIAAVDDNFARFYENNTSKSIEECCEYIVSQAKANGCAGYSDNEVYGWAIHYWEEADLKVEAVNCSKVVINHHIDLTEEEKADARKQAILSLQREYEEKMRRPAIKKTVTKEVEPEQPTLF